MARRNYKDFAASTLAAGISDSANTLDVAAGEGAKFPDAPFVIWIGEELILVEGKSGDTFSALTRGLDGSAAAAHSAGDAVEHGFAAKDGDLFWTEWQFRSGNYFTAPTFIQASKQTASCPDGQIRMMPFVVPRDLVIDRIRCEVATAAAGGAVGRLGIYADNDGYPGELIADLGTVAIDSTGYKELTVSQPLDAGFVWLCFVAQGGVPTMRTLGNIAAPATTDTFSTVYGWSGNGVSGALPQAPPALTGQNAVPMIAVRIA